MITHETIPALASQGKTTSRLHLNSPHTFYGEPHASPVAQGIRTEMAQAEIEERFFYINHTHLPITVMRRDGLSIGVAPDRSYTSTDFIIRRVLILKNHSLRSAIASLAATNELDSSDLDELRRCFKDFEVGTYREASVLLDYTVTMKDLQDKGGTVYHYLLDLAITSKDQAIAPPHPYSQRFVNVGGFGETMHYKDQPELSLKIRLVDHSAVAAKRYINLAGKVYTLTPQKDAPFGRIAARVKGKMTEKVYPNYLEVFYSAKNDPQVVDNIGVGHMRVAVEEAKETMGLYDTYEEAMAAGNVEQARKERLTVRLHELEILKADLATKRSMMEQEELRLRADLNREKAKLEQQQAELATLQLTQKQEQTRLDQGLLSLENERKSLDLRRKAQDDILERERKEQNERLASIRDDRESRIRLESLQWKEFYEARSASRKDTSEFVKFVPGLLLGILGIAAAWLKFSTPGKAT